MIKEFQMQGFLPIFEITLHLQTKKLVVFNGRLDALLQNITLKV